MHNSLNSAFITRLDAAPRRTVARSHRPRLFQRRRFDHLSASTASDVATIPAASNRQSEVRTSAGALVRSFAYRAGGDIAAQTVAPATLYTHDARGRIASITEGGVLAASYRYDWREHRTASMDASGAQTHYLFDDEGHLLAEYDALSGNLLREYAWAGDMVLAMATGPVAAPNWSYIATGHLNEPVMVTSQAGAVVSSTTRDPWGNPILIAGANVIALGYPGQWKDLTGSLFHNWNRDYDPTLGRYIESDPIGLAGGSNLYGYVGGNPVNRVDPEGLETYWEHYTGLPDSYRKSAINAIAGASDAATLGATNWVRKKIGANRDVDPCTEAYQNGEIASLVLGVGRLAYAGSAKAASLLARDGRQANASRNELKRIFRFGLFPKARMYPYQQSLTKYGSDAAVKAAAGRTNTGLNVAGAASATGGGIGVSSANCNGCDR